MLRDFQGYNRMGLSAPAGLSWDTCSASPQLPCKDPGLPCRKLPGGETTEKGQDAQEPHLFVFPAQSPDVWSEEDFNTTPV